MMEAWEEGLASQQTMNGMRTRFKMYLVVDLVVGKKGEYWASR